MVRKPILLTPGGLFLHQLITESSQYFIFAGKQAISPGQTCLDMAGASGVRINT
jgi:hypothetical protein